MRTTWIFSFAVCDFWLLFSSLVSAVAPTAIMLDATTVAITKSTRQRRTNDDHRYDRSWRRVLSLAHPIASDDDDTVAKTGGGGSTETGNSDDATTITTTSISSTTQSYGISAEATTILDASNTGDDATSSTSDDDKNSKTKKKQKKKDSKRSSSESSSSSTTSSSSTASTNSTNTSDTNNDNQGSKNNTNTTDDDTVTTDGYDMNKPLNPVVDDVLQFMDDDSIVKNGNQTHTVFPQEQDDPPMWPVVVVGTFVMAALTLFAATAYNKYQKRTQYHSVSELIV